MTIQSGENCPISRWRKMRKFLSSIWLSWWLVPTSVGSLGGPYAWGSLAVWCSQTKRTPYSRTPKAGHIEAGRSDVKFGGNLTFQEWSLGASSDAHSAFQNKGGRLLARNCSDRALESLGQKNGPRRDMRMTVFIVTGFRCGPLMGLHPYSLLSACMGPASHAVTPSQSLEKAKSIASWGHCFSQEWEDWPGPVAKVLQTGPFLLAKMRVLQATFHLSGQFQSPRIKGFF